MGKRLGFRRTLLGLGRNEVVAHIPGVDATLYASLRVRRRIQYDESSARWLTDHEVWTNDLSAVLHEY